MLSYSMRRKSLTRRSGMRRVWCRLVQCTHDLLHSFKHMTDRIDLHKNTHDDNIKSLRTMGPDKLMKGCGACTTYSGREKREGTGRALWRGR